MIRLAGILAPLKNKAYCCTMVILLALTMGSHPLQAVPSSPRDQFIAAALAAHDQETFNRAVKLYQQIDTAQKLQSPPKQPHPNHMRLIWGLTRLANFYHNQGQLQQAAELHTQVLDLLEEQQSSANLHFRVTPLKSLAAIWLAQGHISQARQALEQALDLLEKIHGSSSLLIVDILEQLVKIHLMQEQPKTALSRLQRIAKVQEEALMPNTPGQAIILARLGQYYQQIGQNDLAQSHFHQAKEILMKTSGPYHGARVEILNNLAILANKKFHQNPDDPSQIIESLKGALAISENMNGSDHPDLVPILDRLAKLYQTMGKPNQGRPIIMRVITLVEKHYGPDHKKTAFAILTLAQNFLMANQMEPAVPLYNRALGIFRHQHHPPTAENEKETEVKGRETDKKKTDEEETQANSFTTQQHQNNMGLAQTLTGLANIFHKQGKVAAAERNQREALEILINTVGPKHPETMAAHRFQTELASRLESRKQDVKTNNIHLLKQVRNMQERLLFVNDDQSNPITNRRGMTIGTATNLLEHPSGRPPSTQATKQVLDEVLPLPLPTEPKPAPLEKNLEP